MKTLQILVKQIVRIDDRYWTIIPINSLSSRKALHLGLMAEFIDQDGQVIEGKIIPRETMLPYGHSGYGILVDSRPPQVVVEKIVPRQMRRVS